MKYVLIFMAALILLMCVALGWVVGYEHGRDDGCQYEGIECPQAKLFHNGDTIYPSLACPDTLIVKNAIGLNKGMISIDGTDWSIDSLLHEHCDRIDGKKSYILNEEYGYDFLTKEEWDSIKIYTKKY